MSKSRLLTTLKILKDFLWNHFFSNDFVNKDLLTDWGIKGLWPSHLKLSHPP